MNSLKIGTVLVLLSFITTAAFDAPKQHSAPDARAWSIDKAHSNINFEVTHFFTPVTGTFHEYTSDINFDPAKLEESSVKVEIMVNSIDTDNEKRDGHLKSDDFFHADKYPKITFVSDNISRKSENEFVANGTLTIKGVTKKIQLPFKLLGMRDHPMKENTTVAGLKADYTLDRTDYEVGVGDWAATAVVGDEVDISIALELNSVAK